MLRTIHLHGKLGRTFGASHRFDVETAGEGLRALHCAFPTFAEELKIGRYQVIRGRRHGGMDIQIEHINDFKLGSADIHIIPVAAGAKSGGNGVVKAVAGIALVGAAIFLSGGTLAAPLSGMSGTLIPGVTLTYGNLAVLGLGLTLAGAASMMSKATPTPTQSNSFTLSGPTNVNAQGYAIPLIYGQVICGSQGISAGADIEDIAVA